MKVLILQPNSVHAEWARSTDHCNNCICYNARGMYEELQMTITVKFLRAFRLVYRNCSSWLLHCKYQHHHISCPCKVTGVTNEALFCEEESLYGIIFAVDVHVAMFSKYLQNGSFHISEPLRSDWWTTSNILCNRWTREKQTLIELHTCNTIMLFRS